MNHSEEMSLLSYLKHISKSLDFIEQDLSHLNRNLNSIATDLRNYVVYSEPRYLVVGEEDTINEDHSTELRDSDPDIREWFAGAETN